MRIKVNFHSDVPVYKQIVERVEDAILSGELKEGEEIPSIRKLAVEANVNPNTVAKAYFVLQSKGYIYSIAGIGYRVTKPPVSSLEERVEEIERKIEEDIKKMMGFSLTDEEVKERVRRIVERVIKDDNRESRKT